jgi:ADP-L-glycero-D-manno-heptose 6-epimerase
LAQRVGVEALLAVDHPVPPAKGANLAPFPGHAFLPHDQFITQLEAGQIQADVIFHMGACSDTTQPSWDYLLDNNLHYTQRIWNWCAATGGRMINASSAATYGDGSRGFDDTTDLRELVPLNLYGKSKHDFDLWQEAQVLDLATPRPVQYAGLKFFNVFGPGESHKGRMASMVYHGYHQIQKEGRVKLFKSHRPDYADGGQLRDFIYVNDVVAVILSLLDRPEVSGLFNLGTGHARSFRELLEAVFQSLGRKPEIDYIPMPEDLQGKYQYYTQATMAKIRAAGIPFEPQSLEASVDDYVQKYLIGRTV